MSTADTVTITEVGPRDGLQNEAKIVPTATKVELIQRLAATGLSSIETTAWVRPDRIPQLADAADVMSQLGELPGVNVAALIPNMKGYESAESTRLDTVAVFTAATEAFCERNINTSIAGSLERFAPVIEAALSNGRRVRAYISTAFGCPFEGNVAASAVHHVAHQLFQQGAHEVVMSDTIGVGVPNQVREVCAPLVEQYGAVAIGLHLHDTRGTALANVSAGLDLGVRSFDSSVAGLGGCPYAPGATGNVATEDLVWFLEHSGMTTGVNLEALIDVAKWISSLLGKPISGHIADAPIWK